MTEDDIIDLIHERLDEHDGHLRDACEDVARWVGEHLGAEEAWERFGTRAIIAIEADHQRDIRQGGGSDDEWTPPEGWGTDGRAARIAAEGPDRIIAFRGDRIRIGDITGTQLIEWAEELRERARAQLRTADRYQEIGETAGERTLDEAWDDLHDDQQEFLAGRSEPGRGEAT